MSTRNSIIAKAFQSMKNFHFIKVIYNQSKKCFGQAPPSPQNSVEVSESLKNQYCMGGGAFRDVSIQKMVCPIIFYSDRKTR